MTKTSFALRLLLAGLCGLASPPVRAQNPQHLVFTGLRSVASQGQFNAVKTDAAGNLYLLLDQKDGVRLLKTDPTATNLLAQAQLGAKGDIGLAMAIDPTTVDVIFGLAQSQQMLKKNADAARNYQLYLDIVPNGPKAKQALKALKTLQPGN